MSARSPLPSATPRVSLGKRVCSRREVRWPAASPRSSALRISSNATCFKAIGGYRETFEFYGEEKDFCLRLIDAGYQTIYLPDALVIHEPDRAGRSQQRYLRYVTRNDCLTALYNEPFTRLTWLLPARFALYFRMRRDWQIRDPLGWLWILRELAGHANAVIRDRAPVSRDTIATWKRLRESPEPYVRQPLEPLEPLEP